jgi:adenine-specific DNA-methyltransferase
MAFSLPQHEPELDRDFRRSRGVFYTPADLAEWITRETYGPLVRVWNGMDAPPRVLDPACGGGVFLQAAGNLLRARCRDLCLSPDAEQRAIDQAIFGVEVDAEEVVVTRNRLQSFVGMNVQQADALAADLPGGFDAVIGNPPYVNIRELARARPKTEVTRWRSRFRTARGNFDLYVLFIERALELLKPGGRLGFIIPNKWTTLDYARPLREVLLRETTLEQIVDLTSLRVFPEASVYPQVLILQKSPARPKHQVHFVQIKNHSAFQQLAAGELQRFVAQRDFDARAFILGNDLRVERRVATMPLESLATLHSGASGYSATELSKCLREASSVGSEDSSDVVDFIVSGNIDRYGIKFGNVRFLKQLWRMPVLPLREEYLSPDKITLYRCPKIVLSGMGKRLEAAYDDVGCALGVQVYAASDLQVDPYYLLGVLNSKLLSYLFRERFAAKCLAGNYLSLNKGQLAQLPIRTVGPDDNQATTCQRQIANIARQLTQKYSRALDDQLDELVYQLYELTAAERVTVEAAFVQVGNDRRVA